MDLINGVIITPLRRIFHPKGDVLHGMKRSDTGYAGFGEAYFSNVGYDEIKAWKLHHKMTLNLIVPAGSVKFVMYDKREKSNTFNKISEVIVSEDNYVRLTIPPGIWFGFKGVGKQLNLVLNIANLEHDPNEVSRKEIDEMDYNW